MLLPSRTTVCPRDTCAHTPAGAHRPMALAATCGPCGCGPISDDTSRVRAVGGRNGMKLADNMPWRCEQAKRDAALPLVGVPSGIVAAGLTPGADRMPATHWVVAGTFMVWPTMAPPNATT